MSTSPNMDATQYQDSVDFFLGLKDKTAKIAAPKKGTNVSRDSRAAIRAALKKTKAEGKVLGGRKLGTKEAPAKAKPAAVRVSTAKSDAAVGDLKKIKSTPPPKSTLSKIKLNSAAQKEKEAMVGHLLKYLNASGKGFSKGLLANKEALLERLSRYGGNAVRLAKGKPVKWSPVSIARAKARKHGAGNAFRAGRATAKHLSTPHGAAQGVDVAKNVWARMAGKSALSKEDVLKAGGLAALTAIGVKSMTS